MNRLLKALLVCWFTRVALYMQALVNIRTVMAFNGQEVTQGRYRAALARPQTFAIRQGFLSGFVTGTIHGELPVPHQLATIMACAYILFPGPCCQHQIETTMT